VDTSVFLFRKNYKIFNSIIKYIAVYMVDVLISFKKPMKMFFHYQTMFFNISPIIRKRMIWLMNMPISISMCQSIFPRWMGISFQGFSSTNFRAEKFFICLNSIRMSEKNFFTMKTFNRFFRGKSLLHSLSISFMGDIVKLYLEGGLI